MSPAPLSFAAVYEAFCASRRDYSQRPFLKVVADTARRYDVEPGELTYSEAGEQVDRLADLYLQKGLGPGRRVALMLHNRPEFFWHWLALNAVGASVVPLNPDWSLAEISYVLGHSEACLVVTLAESRRRIEQAVQSIAQAPLVTASDEVARLRSLATSSNGRSLGPAAECALLYTSGTTGKPKGCILSNQYFLWGGEWYQSIGALCQLHPGEDCLVTPLPMHHMNAMAVSTMAMMMTGSCIAPLDRFHPSGWWGSVREAEATIIHYLGVMPAILLDQVPEPLEVRHGVRFGFGAGAGAAHHERFERRFGFPLIEAWAMTETGLGAAIIANVEPRKPGTACFGRPADDVQWRIVDDDGQDAAIGETGELWVRHAGGQGRFGFFSGYLKDPAATAAAWEGGYFHTGDLVRRDPDGSFHFVDRKKNIIRRSGENIAAVEVESAIADHPGVSDVGVAPVPDPLRGDEVMALVVLGEGFEAVDHSSLAVELVQHCLERLAYFKVPGYVGFCERLPLTATEKIQRADLKALAGAKLKAGECVDTRSLKRRRN